MDRLVKTEVKELEILYKKGQKCSATFKLTNLMHTMSVAISLSTTSSSPAFSFSHPLSIISPLSTVSYTVVLSSSDPPPLSSAVSVKSAMLPTGKASAEDLRRLFSVPGRHVFRDAVVPISVVGVQIAEAIVKESGEFRWFEKAVSRCSVREVNSLLRSGVESGNAGFVRLLIEKGGDVNRRSLICLAVRGGHVDVLKLLIDSGCRSIIGEGGGGRSDSFLHDAAAENRVDILQILSSNFRSIDMNITDSNGRTPIHTAASCGHEKAIRFISSVGGDPDLTDKKGSTPLHLAAEKGHVKATKCLLETSIYTKQAVNKSGKTAYDLAVENGHRELYEMLSPIKDELLTTSRTGDAEGVRNCLRKGAEVNSRDQNGWSPLHRAAFKGKSENVKVLLSKGAEVDAVDGDGYTPLHCAVEAGQLKVAVMLIGHGAKVSLKGIKGGLLGMKNHQSGRVVDLCEEQKS
ncbi:Protein VAPYRIN-LIKE [Linum perenne]